MDPTQGNRLAAIHTTMADDVLVLRGFTGDEQLSRPFRYLAELSSTNPAINFAGYIGKPVGIGLNLGKKGTRYFHGIVSRFLQVPGDGGGGRYQAEIVPWLWLLTRTSDCRIYQEKTVVDIVEDVFRRRGFTDYKLKLSRTYRTWEYCVQYRETDFNFVNRLLEQEGITYFFTHTDSAHIMTLADSPSAHGPAEGYGEVAWHPVDDGGNTRECVRNWITEQQIQSASYVHTEYNFTKPRADLQAGAHFPDAIKGHDWEIFDFPGEYDTVADGETYARVRIEELGAAQDTFRGEGDPLGLAAGNTFELTDHPRNDQNAKYLITGIHHRFDQSSYVTGAAGGGTPYRCEFTAIPAARQYRPSRATPKPIIQGPQTAAVVGPDGEEIHVDKYGRVKVIFHWDRYSKADENSSCWIRVSSEWAGKKWGSIHTPRIGQEVIVEFLEGDPDRPIITGRVYNEVAMPPYDLPAEKTKSTLKSNSSKGGAGFNEIRFEDKKGQEQVFIHGEKNQDVRIKNDTFEWIGNNRHLIVKKDQVELVENNRSETVKADHMEKIGKDRHLKVVGKEAKEVGESLSLTVKGDVIEVFKKNHSEQTTNDYYLKADNIVIEGMTNVTIKVGGSHIVLAADGIEIKTGGTVKVESGATMDLKASAPLTMQSSATADLKSPMTTVKGDGMLTLKGGVVMIN